MEKEFVTYAQALILKELGFDEPCFAAYSEDEDNSSLFIYWNDLVNMSELFISQDNCKKFNYECLAPLKQQVFRWFREKCDWTIKVNQVTKNNWSYTLNNFPKDRTYYGEVYKTYEEAESACIDKLIEIVKNR